MNKIILTITREEDGRVSISGPLDNKVLCYGLLECGKDALRDFCGGVAEAKKIIEAPRIIAPKLNGG